MRRIIEVFALLAFIVTGACIGKASFAQGEERGHPVLQLGANKIEVDHGQPTLRGRNPEDLIKPGQAWRMGSNDPTTLTTQASLKFGGQVITAGKYILQAKLVEAQNWHLLIESESGSLSTEVPFTLQRLDKPVEVLTIALEKQDKGGRLVVRWGKLALATEFQLTATTASADGGDTWNELSSFHSVMSQTFHPMEEGNLTPIRKRAEEMAAKAQQWANSKPPKVYEKAEIQANVARLAAESKALAKLVAAKASDAQIKLSLAALHDRFHEIAGMCRDAQKHDQ